jgi:hypothetical protein
MTEVFFARYTWNQDDGDHDIGMYSTLERAKEELDKKIKELINDFGGTSYIPYGASFVITSHELDSELSYCPVYIDFFRDEELVKLNNSKYWRSKNGQD